MAAILILVAVGYLLLYALAAVPGTVQPHPQGLLLLLPSTMDSFRDFELRQLDHLPLPPPSVTMMMSSLAAEDYDIMGD